MRWKSSHALPVSSAFSLRRVARSAGEHELVAKFGSLDRLADELVHGGGELGGWNGGVRDERRRMAGLILTDLATASVLSLRSDVGMGVALCASMCSTVRGPRCRQGSLAWRE